MHAPARGFSLVELMVVVAVIGVGAGVALMNMSEQVAEARAQADGEAMAQRIQTEQRAARQRMVGLRVRRDASHTELTFEEVNKCADTAPLRQRKHKFLSTTQLEISSEEDVVCWESSGAPAGSGVGGGIGLPGLNNLGSEGEAEAPKLTSVPPDLTVNAGIHRRRARKMRSSKAGPLIAVAAEGVAHASTDE